MQSPYRIEIAFASWAEVRAACSFSPGLAVVRALCAEEPPAARTLVRLVLRVGFSVAEVASARAGPAKDGEQSFVVHGAMASALRSWVAEAPDGAHAAQKAAASTRYSCAVPTAFAWDGGEGEGRIADVSNGGTKLVELSAEPPVGSLLRVEIRGGPAEGLVYHGRVMWLDRRTGRAGLRFFPRARVEIERLARWLRAVVVDAYVRKAM